MTLRPKTRSSVAVIGMGNWGTSLARALEVAGIEVDARIVPLGRRTTRGASRYVGFDEARFTADVLWLCVPDAVIARVSRQLAAHIAKRPGRQRRQIVVHSSGALSSTVLEAVQQAGACVASVHPLMSFPTRKPVSLQGVPFGVEAGPDSRRILYALVRQMGGRPFAIKAPGKALYHAAGMLASPLLVSHLAAAQQVAVLAGFSPLQARRLIEPIVRATLDRLFQQGAQESFSGPIARGDVQTIRLHLQALEAHPMLVDIYRALGEYALDVLPSAASHELMKLFRATTANRMRNYKRPGAPLRHAQREGKNDGD